MFSAFHSGGESVRLFFAYFNLESEFLQEI